MSVSWLSWQRGGGLNEAVKWGAPESHISETGECSSATLELSLMHLEAVQQQQGLQSSSAALGWPLVHLECCNDAHVSLRLRDLRGRQLTSFPVASASEQSKDIATR